MEQLCKAVNVALREVFPSSVEVSWGSLQINASSVASMHCDKNNEGLSLICLFGSFDGGALLRADRSPWLSEPGMVLYFDGTQPHASALYTGQRFSIVAFLHESTKHLFARFALYVFVGLPSPKCDYRPISSTVGDRLCLSSVAFADW